MTIRAGNGHSWRYSDYATRIPTEHLYGRGMWHSVDDCVHSKCGADSPADMAPIPNGPGDLSVDEFADGIRAAIAEHGDPLVQRAAGAASPRVFSLVRTEDVSGVSGVGIVAQGVQFRDGQVVLQWCCPGLPSSVAVWASLEDVLTIHGHRGRTVISWADGRD
jgi:hypothetical protein